VPTIDLPIGTIEYEETGGAGPTIVFLHGLLMDSSLWSDVIGELASDYRCVAPTLPLGAHRHAVTLDADLSLHSIAQAVEDLIDRLDLQDVTLVGNDTGGALVQLMMGRPSSRIGRVVLVSCDAFDNFPPGLTGKTLFMSGKFPPALFNVFMQHLRVRPIRRLPIVFGWLTKRGDTRTKQWLKPLFSRRDIRRDTIRVLQAAAADPQILVDAAPSLSEFDRPALVLWAREDRVMPISGGRRLAELLPNSRFVEVEDSYTLVPLDQPARLAELVRDFVPAPERQSAA
jgi:pimeloyl-ACP methyl ester carboxylesterase